MEEGEGKAEGGRAARPTSDAAAPVGERHHRAARAARL